MKPELDEIGSASSFRRHDSEIRHQRQSEPASDRRALNRGYYWFLASKEAHCLRIKLRSPRIARARQIEIRPRTKRFPSGRQHNRATRRVVVKSGERLDQIENQLTIKIVMRRPVDLQQGNEVLAADRNISIPRACDGQR